MILPSSSLKAEHPKTPVDAEIVEIHICLTKCGFGALDFSGDIVIIHEKKDEGWWFGSLNEKKGHFPAAYVEELPSSARNMATQK